MIGEGAGRGPARSHVGDSPPRAHMGFAAPALAHDALLERAAPQPAPLPAPMLPTAAVLQGTHSRYSTNNMFLQLLVVASRQLVDSIVSF